MEKRLMWQRYAIRLVQLMIVAFLVCGLLAACESPELLGAKAHVDQAITELPPIPQVDLLKTLAYQWSKAGGGYVCFYARAYLVIGTQRPAVAVLDDYTAQLPQLDWVLETELQHRRVMLTARHFIRGRHERLVIEPLGIGTEAANSVDHEALKRTYETLQTIRVDYMLPSRNEC
jgi:hypothetical protein